MDIDLPKAIPEIVVFEIYRRGLQKSFRGSRYGSGHGKSPRAAKTKVGRRERETAAIMANRRRTVLHTVMVVCAVINVGYGKGRARSQI